MNALDLDVKRAAEACRCDLDDIVSLEMRERCRELWLVQRHMRGQLVDVGAKRHQLPQFLHHPASDQESIVAHESGADFPEVLLGGLIMSELLPVSFKKGRGTARQQSWPVAPSPACRCRQGRLQ
jgi:hypothetical protein